MSGVILSRYETISAPAEAPDFHDTERSDSMVATDSLPATPAASNGQTPAPEYSVAKSPKQIKFPSEIVHLTTNAAVTLCNRAVAWTEQRGPTADETRWVCQPCGFAMAAGRVSPATSSRYSPRKAGPAPAPPAPPRSPLEEKARELEALATEIKHLAEERKRALARFEQLKAEMTRFLSSVTVGTD